MHLNTVPSDTLVIIIITQGNTEKAIRLILANLLGCTHAGNELIGG